MEKSSQAYSICNNKSLNQDPTLLLLQTVPESEIREELFLLSVILFYYRSSIFEYICTALSLHWLSYYLESVSHGYQLTCSHGTRYQKPNLSALSFK